MGRTVRVQGARPKTGIGHLSAAAACFGIEVPEAAGIAQETRRLLQTGAFATALLRAALAAILPADRVLMLGAAEGVVAAAIARNCRPASILAFEGDPHRVARARALLWHNALTDRVTMRHGVVLAGTDDIDDPGAPCTIRDGTPPIIRHERLRRTDLHNVIVTDTDGEESAFLRGANLAGVRLILTAVHSDDREGVKHCRSALRRAGYERDLGLSGPDVDLFRRIRV